MSKFVMKCPTCASEKNEDVYVTVSGGLFNTGLFAKKIVKCPHGHEINVKTDRMAVKICPHCGNNVVFDQSKGESALCPVCKTKINTLNENTSAVQIYCPQCGCQHTVAKDAATIECPVCNVTIDVQREIGKRNMQKQNAVSVLKYEGDNNTFVWKHPIEDFKLGSQLIVHDSQEALFFCGGQALDLFPGGTYTLTTENIPLLSSVYKLPSGEKTFHSEVYFINKTVHMGIKWGTSSRIKIPDPYSGMNLSLGANGIFNIKVTDSKRLVLKLVGTTDIFAHSNNINADAEKSKTGDSSGDILRYIKTVIVNKVRTIFAAVIKKNNWSVFEIDAYIEELSSQIKELINPELEEYGLTLPDFLIISISTPEDLPAETKAERDERDLYIQIKQQAGNRFFKIKNAENDADIAIAQQKKELIEAETAAKLKVIRSQGEAESARIKGYADADVMKAKGYNAKDEMNFEVQKTFAENIGNIGGTGGNTFGDLVSLGAGLGMMGKIGNQVAEMMDMPSNSVNAEPSADTWDCICGNKNVVGNFCSNCGKSKPKPDETWDCVCGNKNTIGKFCNKCGKPKPEKETWNCSCGNRNITGNFCNNCGKAKPNNNTWDCTCGNKGIIGNFCGKCGRKHEDGGI